MESAGILVLEFCLLCFIAALFWAAKQNLTATAARQQTQTLKEIRQVEETIQGLLDVLENKAVEIESRLSSFSSEVPSQVKVELAEPGIASKSQTQGQAESDLSFDRHLEMVSETDSFQPAPILRVNTVVAHEESVEVRRSVSDALRLVDKGADARAVARATGLTMAEIETAIRMRQLRGESVEALHRSNTQETNS